MNKGTYIICSSSNLTNWIKGDVAEPFYVGLVNKVNENSLTVQWCEHVPKKANEKYGTGTFSLSWISKNKPTTTEIDNSLVIHSFKNLTGKNKLPKHVLKCLEDHYSSQKIKTSKNSN